MCDRNHVYSKVFSAREGIWSIAPACPPPPTATAAKADDSKREDSATGRATMSIYATLWHLHFPRHGDAYAGCEWIDVLAQGVTFALWCSSRARR